MAIPMARPWKHPDTEVLYYRGRVPADLVDQLKGTRVQITVDGLSSVVTLAAHCKVSLQTKDAGEAKARHANVEMTAGFLEVFLAAMQGNLESD